MNRILIIGKSGQLGGSLIKLARDRSIVFPDRSELDIADNKSVARCLDKYQPNVVINTAAFHNVPQCENLPDEAMSINCSAVYRLAKVCAERRIKIVSFSTDYVFSGNQRNAYTEHDVPNPLQMYGISRLAGEYAAFAAAPQHAIIVRTAGLYGPSGAISKGGNFVDKRLADASQSHVLQISSEQTVSPTFSDDLATAVYELVENEHTQPGIYHLVNEGECSWYEFTKKIFEIAGLKNQIEPIDRNGVSGNMRRPLYSALKNTKAKNLGIELPHWTSAIERYIKLYRV